MGIVWDGAVNGPSLGPWIYEMTGTWPKTTALVNGYADMSLTVGVYGTYLNISAGPYILWGLRNDPDLGSGNISIRLTVDGTILFTKTGVPYSSGNDVVGLFFDDGGNDVGPVLVRSTLKIEAARDGSGTNRVRWLYTPYSL